MNSQTQNAIDMVLAESLKTLSAIKPIEKITIKEITDRAGVIRPTFYNHFQDKYELLEWIAINELFKPAEPLFAAGMLKEGVTFVLTTMSKEREFYHRAVALEGQNSFNDIFNRCVATAIIRYIKLDQIESVAHYGWLTKEVVAEFYAHAITYVVIEWINNGMKIPVEELADVYVKMFQVSILEVIKGTNI